MQMQMLFVVLAGTAPPVLEHAGPLRFGDAYTIDSGCLGGTQQVFIGLPGSYGSSDRGYPVIVVMDGDEYFELACVSVKALAACGGMPEVIVVGIECGDPMTFYTPTNAPVPDGTPLPSSGRGPEYLAFIQGELLPAVRASFRTEPYTVLFGHSVAGLFTVYAMLEGDGTIGGFIASSPSLWWDGELMTGLVPLRENGRVGTRTRLYFSMGGEGETMLPPAERFAEALGETSDVDFLFERFPETVHQFVPFKSFPGGIEFVFAPWRIDDPVADLGLEDAVRHYEDLSRIYGYDVVIPEGMLNTIGYSAMRRGDIDEALEAFRTNARNFPGSSNAYDSLGEALLAAGDTTGARENYLRSLELDPSNSNAEAVLRDIRP